MSGYGILNLTSNSAPYTYFDTIKERYYERRGVLYKKVLNEPEDRTKSASEMLYVSECANPSGIPVMLEKFRWALGVLLDEPGWKDCDYFVRTNSSTFVNLELLEPALSRLPKRRCYAGSIVFGRLVSGTCIVISRDVARYLARAGISRYMECYDDVAISRLMDRRLIRMRDIPMRLFIDNAIHDIDTIRDALSRFALIRVKNDENRMLYDIDVWNKIAEIKGMPLPERAAPAGGGAPR